ncbi:MAG: hypothetical protein DRR06_17855, partial [Gammaproteobacteria bacterium]
MKLEHAIVHALALTRELHEALNEGRMDQYAGILARRSAAMADFQAVHEAAAPDERRHCRPLLQELGRLDAELQT